ncbi:hypothetical protein L6164_021100 [Bauhinia variegata]|uniref:Uncharacterized protein n=1 Tax=Bauhinia variegata TaxID=167791 RepID=A0ACB9MX28_BAUVA|nr:hypothetical protein L6164_021100 [Bauhinia variegata]
MVDFDQWTLNPTSSFSFWNKEPLCEKHRSVDKRLACLKSSIGKRAENSCFPCSLRDMTNYSINTNHAVQGKVIHFEAS